MFNLFEICPTLYKLKLKPSNFFKKIEFFATKNVYWLVQRHKDKFY